MNTKLLSLLATICLACFFIILVEWFYASWAQNATLKSLVPKDEKTLLDEMPNIDLHKQAQDNYVDFVARPLFIKGRRPVAEMPIQETTAAVQNADIPIAFDWELIGIYSTEKGLSVLLSRGTAKSAKDKYRKVALGADLDGWKLSEINHDKAVVKQGDQQKELLLRKVKVKDPSRKIDVPNRFNAPQPEEAQMLPPIPAQGELENTHE